VAENWEEKQGSTEIDGKTDGVEIGIWVNPKNYAREAGTTEKLRTIRRSVRLFLLHGHPG
jgi:hypothetical protein